MILDIDAGEVIRQRLVVGAAIDESVELSFLESAHFRLELFTITRNVDDGTVSPGAAVMALHDLHQRVTAVIDSRS